MRTTPLALAAVGLLLARGALAMCYEVYNGDRVIYRSVRTPVDLSKPLHQTVPAEFGPKATLVFFPKDEGCLNLDLRKTAPVLSNEDVGTVFAGSKGPALNLDPYFRER